jgi:hypothetical protein
MRMERNGLFWRAVASGAVAVSLTAGSANAAGERAGVAGAVRGAVKQVAFNAASSVGRNVASKDPINLGDRIITGNQSGLQVLLLDQTVFTIGPNASMVIDKFVYDPSKAGGSVGVTISKGVFRFVSGKVARTNPDGFKLKLKVATLSVRGTTGVGIAGDKSATIILAGPGPKNNTSDVPSRLIVTANGKTVVISRPSWGVTIANGVTSAPKYFSPSQIQKIVGALRVRPAIQRGGKDPLQNVNPAAGQRAAMPHGLVSYTEQQAFQLPPSLGGLVIQAGNGGVAGSGGGNPGGGGAGTGGGGGAGGGGGVPPRVACALPPKSKGRGFAFGRCR